MTSRIPDTLDPATLRWCADQLDLRRLLGRAGVAVEDGRYKKDENGARYMRIAIARAMRAAATRIENRRRR